MQKKFCLIAAAAALAATSASAQDNAVAPVTNEAMPVDANVTTDMNAVSTVPDMNALEPAPPATTDVVDQSPAAGDGSRGFPWGLLGLVGLIGLLGRRRRD
jgi:MYXO-CTERM domain-containing protein